MRLETINLNSNYIQYVGDDVQHLTALFELLLADNRISWLPGALGKLKELRTLDLTLNNLEYVCVWGGEGASKEGGEGEGLYHRAHHGRKGLHRHAG